MGLKVYTPEEVAEILRVSPNEVVHEAETGNLAGAFQFAHHWRIPEEAVVRIIQTAALRSSRTEAEHIIVGKPGEGDTGRKRNTNPEQVNKAKKWVWDKLHQVASDLGPYVPRKEFTANGKQGILSISTTDSRLKKGLYWYGFPKHLLQTGRPTVIVAVVADREATEPKAFVIPYDRHKVAIDGWAEDYRGDKKYFIQEDRGHYYLAGKGMERIDIEAYLNAFDLLR